MVDLSVAHAAARAYGQGAGLAQEQVAETASSAFGDLVRDAARQVTEAGQNVTHSVADAAIGEADLIDVVTAVAAAEASLETVVAVRDQVIKAYQEIMRMPI